MTAQAAQLGYLFDESIGVTRRVERENFNVAYSDIVCVISKRNLQADCSRFGIWKRDELPATSRGGYGSSGCPVFTVIRELYLVFVGVCGGSQSMTRPLNSREAPKSIVNVAHDRSRSTAIRFLNCR